MWAGGVLSVFVRTYEEEVRLFLEGGDIKTIHQGLGGVGGGFLEGGGGWEREGFDDAGSVIHSFHPVCWAPALANRMQHQKKSQKPVKAAGEKGKKASAP